MKIKRFKFTAACLVALLVSNITFSQEIENDPGDNPDIPEIPLDGGLSILLVAGVAYGSKKYHNYTKGKNNPENKDLI